MNQASLRQAIIKSGKKALEEGLVTNPREVQIVKSKIFQIEMEVMCFDNLN